jgi:hypothetical protein
VLTASEEVRSLIFAPLVYSQVPYEVLMSYTDNANIQILSLTSKPLKMVWFYAPSYKTAYYLSDLDRDEEHFVLIGHAPIDDVFRQMMDKYTIITE